MGTFENSPTFTPGPWQFWKGVVHPDQHETMGVMRPGRHAQVQTDHEPDLRLIAAAPELLAALKEVVRISDRKHDAWDAARAAIAKAEGATPS